MKGKCNKSIYRFKHGAFATLCLLFSVLCLCLCISSCSEEEPPNHSISFDTYVVTFSGDTKKFKGLVSVSTISPKYYLTSDSFENGAINSFSDSEFKESYELTLKSYDHSNPTVTIQCTALCISDKKLGMTMKVYKMSFDGSVLQDEFTFKSCPKDSPPSHDDYSYRIEL